MNKIIAILLLTTTTVFGQEQDEIITNTSLGFSKDVLQVRVTDSIERETTEYKFDNDGHLIEYNTANERSALKKTFRYDRNKLVERTKTFKNAYRDDYENETFVYEGDKLMSAKHVINSLDETTGYYKDNAVQSFTYENGKLKSVRKKYSGGRKEEENYFYNQGDSLFKTRLIVDESIEDGSILEKEYRNGNRVVIDSYNEGENVPHGREIRIYNDAEKLINQSMYADGEKWNEYKYVYENGFLSKAQFYEMGNLREESTYDKFGHVIQYDSKGGLPYTYEYNDRNDPIVRKLQDSSGKRRNTWRYEYVYK